MGTIKDNLVKEYLERPIAIGDKVLVRGKYLNYNNSRDPESKNRVVVNGVFEENGKTYITVVHPEKMSKYDHETPSKVLFEPEYVEKDTGFIGVNPIPETSWDDCVRNTGAGLNGIIFRIKSDIKKNSGDEYLMSGIRIPELNFNPFVYGKNGERLYYQRDYVWTLEDEQNFIESMYNHLNLGAIVLRKRAWDWLEKEAAARNGEDKNDLGFFDVVDGKQRLHTLMRFISDQFPDKNGNYYSDFSQYAQRRFNECGTLSVLEMEEGGNDAETLRVFLNVNYTGRPLSKEHLDYVRGLYAEKV